MRVPFRGSRAFYWSVVTSSVALLACLHASPAKAIPMAELSFTSQAGDFIGHGQTFDFVYTAANSELFSVSVLQSVGGVPAELLFELGTITSGADNTFAQLFFGTNALGISLQPGTYDNIQRAAFAAPGHAGLDIAFQNRGCDVDTGSLTITDAEFTGTTVDRFDASFVQHCEGAVPALTGTFDYSATGVFSSVPEPATLPLLFSGLAMTGLFIGFQRRRSNPIA